MSTPEPTQPIDAPRLVLTASIGSSAALHGAILLAAVLLAAQVAPAALQQETPHEVTLEQVTIPEDFLPTEHPTFSGAGGTNAMSEKIATKEPEPPKPEPEPEPVKKKLTPKRKRPAPEARSTVHVISARDKNARRAPEAIPRGELPTATRGESGGGAAVPMARGNGGMGNGRQAVMFGYNPEEGHVRKHVAIRDAPDPDLPLKIYQSEVVAAILNKQRYPPAASAEKLAGTVVVVVAVSPSGSLSSARLAKASGHAVLDQAALATARSVRSVPNPPPGWTQRNVRVRFTYP